MNDCTNERTDSADAATTVMAGCSWRGAHVLVVMRALVQ
jgi:hypothetical protein